MTTPLPQPDQLLEISGATGAEGNTCALLTPAIRARLREMQAGQVLEVRVDDPAAAEDVAAWSRLSGHALLATHAEGGGLRFFVQKKTE